MSAVWAVRMKLADLPAALRLRLAPGVEAAVVAPLTSHHAGALWLRGRTWDEAVQKQVARLPADARYTVAADGQLTPLGARVPNAFLPQATWTPLAELARLEPQRAGLPGRRASGAALSLVPSSEEREPAAVLTASSAWKAYALGAPEVRLDRLAFAAAADERVIVWGAPTPPIAGTRLVESDGIFVPAGWIFSPAIDAKLVRRVLKLPAEDAALFDPSGGWERIPREAFVRATRSAVRATFDRPPAETIFDDEPSATLDPRRS